MGNQDGALEDEQIESEGELSSAASTASTAASNNDLQERVARRAQQHFARPARRRAAPHAQLSLFVLVQRHFAQLAQHHTARVEMLRIAVLTERFYFPPPQHFSMIIEIIELQALLRSRDTSLRTEAHTTLAICMAQAAMSQRLYRDNAIDFYELRRREITRFIAFHFALNQSRMQFLNLCVFSFALLRARYRDIVMRGVDDDIIMERIAEAARIEQRINMLAEGFQQLMHMIIDEWVCSGASSFTLEAHRDFMIMFHQFTVLYCRLNAVLPYDFHLIDMDNGIHHRVLSLLNTVLLDPLTYYPNLRTGGDTPNDRSGNRRPRSEADDDVDTRSLTNNNKRPRTN